MNDESPPFKTRVLEVICTSERYGLTEDGTPVHRHVQYYSIDGELLAENCGMDGCNEGHQ